MKELFVIVATDTVRDSDYDYQDAYSGVLGVRVDKAAAVAAAEDFATAIAKEYAEDNSCRATWRRVTEMGGRPLDPPLYQIVADQDPWDSSDDEEDDGEWDGRDDDPDQPVDDLAVCDTVVGEIRVVPVTDIGLTADYVR